MDSTIIRKKFKGYKGLHLLHLNVRSILSKVKLDNFKTQILNSDANIITISETWLIKKYDNTWINIPGYNLLRLDRNWSDNGKSIKKGGGLGIYTKN